MIIPELRYTDKFFLELNILDYESIIVPMTDNDVIQYLLNLFLLYRNYHLYDFYGQEVYELRLDEIKNFIVNSNII